MPKLVIDNMEIEVSKGTKVIDAAEKLGIMIPRFCYHKAMGAVGACRVCAVKFLEGPVKGVQMSCMVDAEDKMVVSTTDPEAVDFRRHVIEWLMINHPHDCPVCDEGGHCLLQDLTVSGGHGIRRFKGKKRTYPDQYLGPLIRHEMNRCIQCYRCSRFYQEFSGYRDLGVMGIAGRVYFGRFEDGILENPFAGNLIDICPTGVYTDKPSRYFGRRWDYRRTPGVCINCSLGCRTTVSTRYRQVARVEARHSEAVNGYFICDRGRYGFYYADRPERPRKGRVRGNGVSAGRALDNAVKRLTLIAEENGPNAVGVIGSARSSLETQAALAHLCKTTGWRGPVFRNSRIIGENVAAAMDALTLENAVSMREIESADAILTLGADPLNEAPMLAMAMRQAARAGASVYAFDPRPLDWPLDYQKETCRTEEMPAKLEHYRDKLHQSKRPIVICGTEITNPEVISAAAGLAADLSRNGKPAGLFYILPQANSFGAALVEEEDTTADDLVREIEAGRIKALVIFESNLWWRYPNRARLERALERLELLVTADYLDYELIRRADIVIPTQTVFEAGGTYVNQEGRAQRVKPAHAGGTPIAQTGGGDHPPRTFRHDIPGGDLMKAWEAAFRLSGQTPPETDEQMIEWMRQNFDALKELNRMGENGVRLFARNSRPDFSRKEASGNRVGGFEALFTAAMFGDELLSRYSPCLKEHGERPAVWMSPADAETLNLSFGDRIGLKLGESMLELNVRISDDTAQGMLIIPRREGLYWQQFSDEGRFIIDANRIQILRKV